MRSRIWLVLGAVAMSGCAGVTADDGTPLPDGMAVGEDGGINIPPVPDRGPEAECTAGDSRACEAAEDCTGLQLCLGGAWGPCDTITELCNGLDDDCNGVVDDGFPGLGMDCASGLGECQQLGTNVCAENGRGVICGAVPGRPGNEACNGLDDDCDGIPDEDAECPEFEAKCNDGLDDDGDGDADCADADCADSPECLGDPEDCATPGDEDGDGRADCDDLDCADFVDCQAPAFELCDVPGDEDGDGAADCDDPDCAGFEACLPEEICDEPGDEDGDGRFNCNDPDCAGHPMCGPPPDEACDVPGDEDGDGLPDCLDDDCADAPNCQPPEEICDQLGDEDGDGDPDCLDADCLDHPFCDAPEEICDQLGDEDGDGRADCADPDCVDAPACNLPEDCAAPGDEDGDGNADCADPDCADFPACAPEEICDQPGDEDGDGAADCDDPDCAGDPVCTPDPDEICDRPGDEDGDGAADCDDPDCDGHPACQPGGPEICDVIGDEDGDGAADCDDPDCAGHPFCAPPMERCDVVGDEDGDGAADCDDPDCAADPRCAPPVDAVPIAQPGGTVDLEGDLDEASPTWARPSAACGVGNGSYAFRTHRIVNNTGEPQLVDVFAVWDGDGYLHAFGDPFDPDDLGNCIGGNDDAPGVGIGASELRLIMPAGATVTLVASTFSTNRFIGPYAIEVSTLADQRVAAPVGGQITLSGALEAADPLWARRNACLAPDDQVDHHYDVFEVQNPTEAEIRVTATAAWDGGDGYLHWFTDGLPFDPAQEDRCGGGNDDFGGLGGSQVVGIPIPAGGAVTVIASTYGAGVTIGAYTITVATD